MKTEKMRTDRESMPKTKKEENKFHVLVVDDDESILKMIRNLLKEFPYSIECTTSGTRAVEKVKKTPIDLILLDLKLPDSDGIDVLREVKRVDESIAVLMMTGYGSILTAVEAIKLGADDYLLKPFKSLAVISMAVNRVKEYKELRDECAFLRQQLDLSYGMESIVGKSKPMTDLYQLVRKVAPLNSAVLLEGESGTGKELFARAIHQNSPRAQRRFSAINCGAIPENLLESELFGYERGAFTGADREKKGYFEAANTGTIFLDEISEMNEMLQVKMLRVIQEKRFQRIGGIDEIETDVRIISSTNRNLEEEVNQGRFRKDLFYRINVIKLHIPPLRERLEDIPLLSHFFMKKYVESFEKSVKSISLEVINAFIQHRWEGNVRELENVIQHAVAMTESEEITISDLPGHIFRFYSTGEGNSIFRAYTEAKRQFEKNYLERALERTKGNIAEASRMTAIPRQNMYEKIKKYKVNPNHFREQH